MKNERSRFTANNIWLTAVKSGLQWNPINSIKRRLSSEAYEKLFFKPNSIESELFGMEILRERKCGCFDLNVNFVRCSCKSIETTFNHR